MSRRGSKGERHFEHIIVVDRRVQSNVITSASYNAIREDFQDREERGR